MEGETLLKKFIFINIILIFLLVGASCHHSGDAVATIKVNTNSKYVDTFEELNLGVLFDYHFNWLKADETWVNLWVERYEQGNPEPEIVDQLIFGLSPNKTEKGNIGFGMIDPSNNTPSVFLYAPGVSNKPTSIERFHQDDGIMGWEDTIADDTLELQLGETYILAILRESPNNLKFYNYENDMEIEKMLNETRGVLLLKIKIDSEEKSVIDRYR